MSGAGARPTKAQRQAEARARAAELRAQQQAAAKRRRFLAIAAVTVGLAVIVGAVGYVVVENARNAARYGSVAWGGQDAAAVAPALADVPAPSTADDEAGIPISDEGVGVAGEGDTVLQVYFDLQCPGCAAFDLLNAADLHTLATEPGITVVYQPLSFLDYTSRGTHYSNRAANALMTVADGDPEHFEGFLAALFADQPVENSSGLSDEQIAEIAAGAGVPQSVVDRFTVTVEGTYSSQQSDGSTVQKTASWRTYAPFVAAATQRASDLFGRYTTPRVMLDGEYLDSDALDWSQQGALAALVRAAAAD